MVFQDYLPRWVAVGSKSSGEGPEFKLVPAAPVNRRTIDSAVKFEPDVNGFDAIGVARTPSVLVEPQRCNCGPITLDRRAVQIVS